MSSKGIYLLLIAHLIGCQQSSTNEQKATADLNHLWFKVIKVTEKVWRIDDHGEDNIYLVEGKDSALVIDSGLGAVNLRDFLKTITPLPLIVVNTHGHPDHVGSNNQFTSVYANAHDFESIKHFTNWKVHQTMLQYMVQSPIHDSLKFVVTDTLYTAALLPIKEGHIFDLGERKVEVIDVQGHTKGSICLLDRKDKLLFTGDNVKSLVWMHMEESVPLTIYQESLQKLSIRKQEFNTLLPGHGEPIESSFLEEQIGCVEKIISGDCVGEPYESVVGNGLLCSHQRSQIAYNPAKIKLINN